MVDFELSNDEIHKEIVRLREENYKLRRIIIKKDKALNEKNKYIKKLNKRKNL